MKDILYKSLLAGSALILVLPALAQPGAPPATPIDGGLSLLLLAGGAYGAKKIYEHKKP